MTCGLSRSDLKIKSPSSERRPPSPLPEGEGADRVVLSRYIDLSYPVELRFEKHEVQLPSPSPSLGERGLIEVLLRMTAT
jgi:hypothetical protein